MPLWLHHKILKRKPWPSCGWMIDRQFTYFSKLPKKKKKKKKGLLYPSSPSLFWRAFCWSFLLLCAQENRHTFAQVLLALKRLVSLESKGNRNWVSCVCVCVCLYNNLVGRLTHKKVCQWADMETPNKCNIFRVSCFSLGKQRSSVRIKDVCTPLPEGKHIGLSYPSDNWVSGVLKAVCNSHCHEWLCWERELLPEVVHYDLSLSPVAQKCNKNLRMQTFVCAISM